MSTVYQQLCPVLFGVGASAELGAKAKELGATKAMIICDKGIEGTGIIDRFEKDLKDNGIDSIRFSDVIADPPKEQIDEIGQLAIDNGVDSVIGVGGGSSLDSAKAVAILIENPLPIEQYYPAKGKQFKQERPLILIPTASGTGSEVTPMSVISDKDSMAKETILRCGNLAILDPELTVSAPDFVTAGTGLDAMSHALEALTSNNTNPKADLLGLHAIKLVKDNLPIAYKDGSNIEARTNLSLASNFAGIAFADASVHFGHCAAHEFGVQFKMPHGEACALTLPEVVKFASDVMPERTREIAEAIGVDVPADASAAEAGELAAEGFRSLMREVGIKSFKDRGISREDVLACAKGAVEKNWFVIMSPKEVNVEVMEGLIANMYDNY